MNTKIETTISTEPEYPECEKLTTLNREISGARALLDWLQDKNAALVIRKWVCESCHKEQDECGCDEEESDLRYHEYDDMTQPDKMIHACFDIDSDKLETERRAMIDAIGQATVVATKAHAGNDDHPA